MAKEIFSTLDPRRYANMDIEPLFDRYLTMLSTSANLIRQGDCLHTRDRQELGKVVQALEARSLSERHRFYMTLQGLRRDHFRDFVEV